jgi:ADP-ribose pyrophosphatase YjhB (NUDIX family)
MSSPQLPIRRDYPDRPIVGVGAVVWYGDKFLLIRRGKAPRKGELSLPGGAQDIGETIFEAAHREIAEETGLEITDLMLVDVVDSIQRDEVNGVKFHYTLVDVVAEATTDKAVAGSDAVAVEWFELSQLDELGLWSETVRIVRKSAKITRRL